MNTIRKPSESWPQERTVDVSLRETERLVREQRDKAAALLQCWEEMLTNIQRVIAFGGTTPAQERPTSGPSRYAGMDLIEAILLYLDQTQVPHTREELIREMLDGSAYRGKGTRPGVQVGKSLDYWLAGRNQKRKIYGKKRLLLVEPKLRQVGDLIGRAEWPDEKFTKKAPNGVATQARKID
jgi:hypothetical protein